MWEGTSSSGLKMQGFYKNLVVQAQQRGRFIIKVNNNEK